MLFILTNSLDATASFLTPLLQRSNTSFIRFDTDFIVSRATFKYSHCEPHLRIDDVWYRPSQIDYIWYRRPEQLKDERFDVSPEGKYANTEWTEFFENFFAHVPKHKWVNHPSCNAAASRKLEQLTTATSFGIKIPDTITTQEPTELREFYEKHAGRIIAKPVSTGYVERQGKERDSLIYTNIVRGEELLNLDDLRVCPTLFQEFIEKAYDVRITVLDNHITAVSLKAQETDGTQRCDIRRNNMSDVSYSKINLPETVKKGIGKFMMKYSLRFAAIDMVVSKNGDWYFLEINPNGQWAWLDTSAATNIGSSFVEVFSNGQTP
jgi:glutathione synthase/RimK-type ligase-like ATP-grasp enzyme